MNSALLKIPDFRVIFSARVLAATSAQAQAVIVGWHVYELTHDPLWLGLIGLCEAVPAIGFAFISGHIVDSHKPAAVYRKSVVALSVISVALWLSVLPSVPLTQDLRLIALFAGVFASGIMRSFMSPSMFAMISHIVPKRMQSEAAAWNSWTFQLASIIGPAVGGILYGSLGADTAFTLPPLLILTCVLILQFLSPTTRAAQSEHRREPFFASVRAGIEFVWQKKVLLSSLSLDMFSVLFGGAVAILPVFSDQVLHMGSQGVGYLRAASSVGAGLVALYLGFRPLRTISGTMLLWMVGGFGASTLAFAFSNSFATAFLCLALAGAFDGVSMVIRSTILQLLTPEPMRGRVSALSLIFVTSSNEIGAFESGLAASALGLIPSLVVGGAMTLVIVAGTAWRVPELRRTRIRPD